LDLESGERVRVSATTENYDPDVTGRSIVDTARISPPTSPLVSVVDTEPFNKWSEIEVLRADLKDGPISLRKEGTTDRIDSLANIPRMGEDLVLENMYLDFDERRASFNVSGVRTTEAKSEIESSVIGYLEIKKELSSTADVESIFKFSTTEGILESMDIDQNDVSLYRYDEGNESWIELPTSIRGNGFKSGNDLRSYIGFEADSSQLSTTFAVAGESNEEVTEEPSEKSEDKNKCVDRRSLGRGENDYRCTGDRNSGRGERNEKSDRRSRGRNKRNR
jgi:PGF-pre-PGF domain-containing protein